MESFAARAAWEDEKVTIVISKEEADGSVVVPIVHPEPTISKMASSSYLDRLSESVHGTGVSAPDWHRLVDLHRPWGETEEHRTTATSVLPNYHLKTPTIPAAQRLPPYG
jgi:hypothetical protein